MDREIGWSIRQLATGDFRAISGSDLRTDLLALINVLFSYGEFCQKNPQEVKASDVKFAGVLLRAVQWFANTLKNSKKAGKRPLSPNPMGAGERGWNTLGVSTDGPVRCEICGTNYPENREQSYYLSELLGFQVVDHCCGGIIDSVYLELGKVFTIAYLEEFAENPSDSRFFTLRYTLVDLMKKAKQRLAEVSDQVAEISEAANVFGESAH